MAPSTTRSSARPPVSLDDAVAHARTGDLWIFRGDSRADRAIRAVTNAPVNHVGMAVVLDDLPPLMWHAELGRSLRDQWTGDHHRGVQLHDLRAAALRWHDSYGQQGWVRQLSPEVGRRHEDALMRVVARWDGASFPSTAALAWRWLRGRRLPSDLPLPALPRRHRDDEAAARAASAYCAEVVAVTLEQMGILLPGKPANWYDPGRFWSGDELPLAPGWAYGLEVGVDFTQPTEPTEVWSE
ncbi:hypothetical protein [Mariniluteicoccus flavus]